MNTKKKFFYSMTAKVLVLIFLFAGVACASTGLGMAARVLDTGVSLEDAWNGRDFSKTYYVAREMLHHGMNDLLSEQKANLYKTNGSYDLNATVDITKMQKGVAASDKDPSTTYTLQDLITLYEDQNARKSLESLTENEYAETALLDQFSGKIDLYYAGSDGKVYGTSYLGYVNSIQEAYQQLALDAENGGDMANEAIYELHADGTVTKLSWQNSTSKSSDNTVSETDTSGSDKTDSAAAADESVTTAEGTDRTAEDVTLTEIGESEACGRLLVDLDAFNQQNHTNCDYANYGEKFWRLYEGGSKAEVVLPQSGEKLAVYALKNPNKVSILDTYKNLLSASETIAEAVTGEQTQTSVSDASEMPLTYYWYQNTKSGEIYTNNSAWKTKNYGDLKSEYIDDTVIPAIFYSQAEAGGKYVHVSSMLNQTGHATGIQDLFLSYLNDEGNGSLNTTDSQIVVALNKDILTNAQFESYFGDSMAQYDHYVDYIKTDVFLVLCGGVLALICLICALVQAGRKDSPKERYAGSFVRNIPVEVLLILDIILWCILTGIAVSITNYYTVFPSLAVPCVLLSAVAAVFVWELLTFVAKCKSGNFRTNSLIQRFGKKIIRFFGNVYENRSVTGKMILLFVVFLIISIVGTALAQWGIGVLILIMFWIVLFVLILHKVMQKQTIKESIHEIAGGNLDYQTDISKLSGDDLEMANDLNSVRDGMQKALQEQMKSERLKTDLITNVSHDIKTPLTSIINYVDILKRENIQDEKIRGYIDVLDRKSQRLKHLTEDLVEASKISSGNIRLDIQTINLKQLIKQTNGEFEEKFENRQLSMVCSLPEEEMLIQADGRRMWRVIENLYNNAAKYAMLGSRVYVDGVCAAGKVIVTIKNISESPLNFDAEELMERFVRGDVSRNTEGSGLGLEIARNLTVMMKGKFDIYLDGDLFKVILTFDQVQPKREAKEHAENMNADSLK